jgi:hypothetical protein
MVICGALKEDPIYEAFERMREFHSQHSDGMNWRMEHCTSRSQLYALVKEFQPELLIFDTHGRFVANETGTELQIGDEFLNGDDVIAHLPQVPLVILSVCWGAPLYGCTNTIAHAFFEKGSFAVTTSLLPLEIFKGSMLYTRVLRNLRYASKTSIHSNWASFMSHNIRTSYFEDMLSVVGRRFGSAAMVSQEDFVERKSAWQADTMLHDKRRSAFMDTLMRVLSCVTPQFVEKARGLLKQHDFLPEYLFYTTLGRADLVTFECWDAKHREPDRTDILVGDIQAGSTPSSAS